MGYYDGMRTEAQRSSASNNSKGKDAKGGVPGRKTQAPFPNRVKPVSNAISILRHLSKARQSATVTQLARVLSINPSTCFNILRTMVWEGLIDFDEPSKSYSLGVALAQLAGAALTESERLAAVRSRLHETAERYQVTLLLWRRVGDERMLLVDVENSSANLQIHLRSGQRLPLLIGATGRAIAGHLGLTKQQLREKFRALRWARRLSFEEYWSDVQEAAERGWAVDEGYFATGATTVAAPVFDRSGRPSHSLVAIMFRDQHEPASIKRISQDLIQLAKEIGTVFS